MNIRSRSLLIGFAAAVLVFFLSNKFLTKRWKDKYTIDYTISVTPARASALPFSYFKIKDILEKRFEDAGYQYKTEAIDTTAIRIILSGITDTAAYRYMSVPGARLQFRELYQLTQLKSMLPVLINEMIPASPGNNASLAEQDSLLRKNSMADDLQTFPSLLIEFSTPYVSPGGRLQPTAEIGYVKLKDTAALMKVLLSEKVMASSPAGIRFRFGEVDKKKRYRKAEDEAVPLYGIRTGNSPDTAILENEDILEVSTSFDQYKRPVINIELNHEGTKKFADLTLANIERHIAIIIDDIVISAPLVFNEIPNGELSIAGNFTGPEANDLSIALRSKKLPAKTTITSVDIKQENRTAKLIRKLLITAAAFLLAGALAFFLFKSLKSR